MTYFDLSELIAMVQFEVQKAFDFAYVLSQTAASEPGKGPALHISLERVELEVPVEFAAVERQVGGTPAPAPGREAAGEGAVTPPKINLEGILGRPFNLKTLSERPLEMPKEKVRAKVVQVRVVGLEAGLGQPEGKPSIGRIKITVIPILR